MSRYQFTTEDRRKGGLARCDGSEAHWNMSIAGWEELCNRHGKKAALAIIKGRVKKQGGTWKLDAGKA